MAKQQTLADWAALAARPYDGERPAVTVYGYLTQRRDATPDRPAISFQMLSAPRSRACTLTWDELHQRVTECANLLRSLGIGPADTVAYMLPNCLEAPVVLLAGATAGVVSPINPLLEASQIAALLRETGAKVLVTLKSLPRSDLAQKAAAAVAEAPSVTTILEVDLVPYLPRVKRLFASLARPRMRVRRQARVLDFEAEASARNHLRLDFEDVQQDRIAAIFHTGGTTGAPKLARHRYEGMIYNGWLGASLLFDAEDVLMCPLPMFHVFAAYPVMMSCVGSGAHMVMPTPAGYRGDGVFDNFWKLIERWQASFLITVPTAIAALVQRPVDADVSSLRIAISGSAPLPLELYNRFRDATGVEIAEGYGLTEATCLVSCNPVFGLKKVGSVGVPLPHSAVRILRQTGEGPVEVPSGEVGEICVYSPGVGSNTVHMAEDPGHLAFAEGHYLRTGDLGRLDEDGYLWITGRAKDLIIRGGHNIDPALIEDAALSHPAVAFAGAIGQPDAFAGELPCVYVELVKGAHVTEADLARHIQGRVIERAAIPKHVEILPELPKTAVGKIFKPALRARATARVLDAELKPARASVAAVDDDKQRGLTAKLSRGPGTDAEAAARIMGGYAISWDWAEDA